MNKSLYLPFLYLFLFTLFVGCESSNVEKSDGKEFNRPESEKLQKEVERIHDEIMPEMSTIEQLRDSIETTLALKNDQLSKEVIQQLIRAKEGLVRADKAMWDWMYDYKPANYKKESDLTAYLVEQRISIKEVQSQMINSMQYAQSTLDQIQNNDQ